MKIIYFIPLIFIVLISCNSTTTHSGSNLNTIITVDSEIKKDSFFPVTSFIKGQMRMLDSLPVTPLHTITIDNKIDSQWVKKAALKILLSPFLSPEIKETNMIGLFKETSFNDQTLNAITFTYDPIKPLPDAVSIRHWDIYIDPESGKVTKVYLLKQQTLKEGNTIQQLTWNTDKYATITTIVNMAGGISKVVKKDKFILNFN